MLLHVIHETRYDYAPPVKTAQHMAHLKPAHNARQQLLKHDLVISPTAAQRSEAADVYGNTRAFFSLQSAHEVLKVVAQSLVATSVPAAPGSTMPWEEARERLRYHRGAAYDPAAEFVFASPHVPRHDDFLAYARPSFTTGRPLLQAAHDLMERIHGDFDYQPEATDVSTPALEALAMRRGVCQDFAHVMLACLRSLGLPARYVSGYLLTEPAPTRRMPGCRSICPASRVRANGATSTRPTAARQARTMWSSLPAATTRMCHRSAASSMGAPGTSCTWP
jgi:transglutaminase-like putative cysteine protease